MTVENRFALMQPAQPVTPVGRLHTKTVVAQRAWWRISSTWVMISIIAGSSFHAGMESIKPQIDSNTSSKYLNMILLLLSGHRVAAAPRRQGLLFLMCVIYLVGYLRPKHCLYSPNSPKYHLGRLKHPSGPIMPHWLGSPPGPFGQASYG